MKTIRPHIVDILKHTLLYIIAIAVGVFLEKSSNNAEEYSQIRSWIIITSLAYLLIASWDIIYKTNETKEETKRIEAEEETRRKAIQQDNYRRISTLFVENKNSKDSAYIVSEKAVQLAEDKIIIVADHSPQTEHLITTPARQEYYFAIENLLRDKIAEKKQFSYTRYMQREERTFKEIHDKGGHINEYKLVAGDEQAFAHCLRVLEIVNHQSCIDLKLYITKYVPSLPSILIVDNHKLLFSIPRRERNNSTLKTAGVIEFTDNTEAGNAIVKTFQDITNELTEDTNEYVRLKSVDRFVEVEFDKYLSGDNNYQIK